MDQIQTDEIGIKIYSPSPQFNDQSTYPSPQFNDQSTYPSPQPPPTTTPPPPPPPPRPNRKRQAISKGVQKTLSKTSMLANFLPTGTLLTFEMVLPTIYGTGQCSHVTTLMISILLCLCTLSCFFFHFTDSFRDPDGKVFYGFVTPKGLAVFKAGLRLDVPKDERYIVGFNDFVHAVMSVMVFAAIALSDHRVTDCLIPGREGEMEEVMESFPLMVGIICSGLFLIFPKTRYGIGCMVA